MSAKQHNKDKSTKDENVHFDMYHFFKRTDVILVALLIVILIIFILYFLSTGANPA